MMPLIAGRNSPFFKRQNNAIFKPQARLRLVQRPNQTRRSHLAGFRNLFGGA